MTDSSKNHYDILGVRRNATTEDIKSAYKEIARVYHPDSNFYREIVMGDELSVDDTQMFKELTAAYATLSNPAKRAQYDLTIPPEMIGWEDDSTAKFHVENLTKSAPSARRNSASNYSSAAYGVFGKSNERTAVDEEIEREINTQTITIRRAVRGGFLRRILLAFGL